ncbi:3-hydroxybutyrate oligomer hydrolase family protein [Dyella sp. A6]|uniref:3-hydroxybutyrate oligomer hydrolase family protein n=1 Tax=Dyella aluminiiresistens TaxID=3069105 RepID=UPI002E764E44|nr:3-hydroxybutyrate oligomer hydrolase family protein [Dyella sp. A6]
MACPEFLVSDVRATEHRGLDDLLSAGLGLAGLAGAPSPFADAARPSPAELRRRAIQTSWKGIADLGPLGGYGTVYGGVPDVPGREYQAFARVPGASQPHRVLLQVPDHLDPTHRCLVVAPSSGSRGVYGAISLAGAWGLPKGCAVAYTDKGTGAGYFDYADDSGVQLDGTRARRGETMLEFEPEPAATDAGVAVKQMNSRDNPEADWGRDVIQAAQFGLAMLDRAFPMLAPFTAQNTKIIAAGLSNGGGAVLQAAGLDDGQLFAGVVALEPNVHAAGQGRPLYDYATEAAIWLPCALATSRFAAVPFGRAPDGSIPPARIQRCASLHADGRLPGATLAAQADAAYERLRAQGWTDLAMATAASTTSFDLWRVIVAGYASSYARTGAADMPCGFHYVTIDRNNQPAPADAATRAAWWADGSGIPPGNGIALRGGMDHSDDPTLAGLDGLRNLWTGDGGGARDVRASIAASAVQLPRADLPLWVLHGAGDGLLPTAFGSEPYVAWLRSDGRAPLYWRVPHAQHFDAFLAVPGFGAAHVPLMPYGYVALERMWAHLFEQVSWPRDLPTPQATPRGEGMLRREMLDLP